MMAMPLQIRMTLIHYHRRLDIVFDETNHSHTRLFSIEIKNGTMKNVMPQYPATESCGSDYNPYMVIVSNLYYPALGSYRNVQSSVLDKDFEMLGKNHSIM